MKNLFAKSRKVDHPYAIYQSDLMPDWEWRVLKTYKTPDSEKKDEYARWYTAVKSPMTYGDWEHGDTYISDMLQVAGCYLTAATDEWAKAYKLDLTEHETLA